MEFEFLKCISWCWSKEIVAFSWNTSMVKACQLNQARRQMGQIYLEEYLSLVHKDDTELKKWMPVVAASRLKYESGKDKNMLLQNIRSTFTV